MESYRGSQSGDQGRQAWAFLPNELWIHAGDSVLWTVATDESHTISFLTPSQLRPTVGQDSNVITPSGSPFDGSSFVNSGEITFGSTYSVKFPTAGNFKLVCLQHLYMNGTIHVLNPLDTLPYDQQAYDQQAQDERNRLLSEADADNRQHNRVIAGAGEVLANGGGFQTAAVVRFFPDTITVHVGETVEWTNSDPMTGHTVNFGNDIPIRQGVNPTLDSDGAIHAIIGSPTDNVSSGVLVALPADRADPTGPNADVPTIFKDLPQWPVSVAVADMNQRFRVTFTQPGVYNYQCVLHDNLGMLGRVIVVP